jgi:hypothetical protein
VANFFDILGAAGQGLSGFSEAQSAQTAAQAQGGMAVEQFKLDAEAQKKAEEDKTRAYKLREMDLTYKLHPEIEEKRQQAKRTWEADNLFDPPLTGLARSNYIVQAVTPTGATPKEKKPTLAETVAERREVAKTLGLKGDDLKFFMANGHLPPPATSTFLFSPEGAPFVGNARAGTVKPVTMPGGGEAPALSKTGTSGSVMSKEDIALAADGIQEKRQPPVFTNFGRAGGGRVKAELERRGVDVSGLVSDWNAKQKTISALNAGPQLRLRQTISTASRSLDVITDLAREWDGGKFPPLNKARVALAKNGALGPKAQQIATKLDLQISDVTSELANVYMGGYSPTNPALELAGKNLSSDWTRDQLLAAVDLARTNLEIRNRSILESVPVGLSEGQQAPGITPTPIPGQRPPLKPLSAYER